MLYLKRRTKTANWLPAIKICTLVTTSFLFHITQCPMYFPSLNFCPSCFLWSRCFLSPQLTRIFFRSQVWIAWESRLGNAPWLYTPMYFFTIVISHSNPLHTHTHTQLCFICFLSFRLYIYRELFGPHPTYHFLPPHPLLASIHIV